MYSVAGCVTAIGNVEKRHAGGEGWTVREVVSAAAREVREVETSCAIAAAISSPECCMQFVIAASRLRVGAARGGVATSTVYSALCSATVINNTDMA